MAFQKQTLEKKVPQAMKGVCAEQMGRLQHRWKCQTQLIDDMRNFMKQRAALEREYAQGLSKLSQQYLSRLPQALISKNAYKVDGFEDHTLVTDVWQRYLQGLERQSSLRHSSSDVYSSKIADLCKAIKAYRMHASKQVFESVGETQRELVQVSGGLGKKKKLYEEKALRALESKGRLKKWK